MTGWPPPSGTFTLVPLSVSTTAVGTPSLTVASAVGVTVFDCPFLSVPVKRLLPPDTIRTVEERLGLTLTTTT